MHYEILPVLLRHVARPCMTAAPGWWQRACCCRCRCSVSWLRRPLQIQSSAQDTGQKGQASANKGKTRIRTRKHAHKATKSTTPALPLARVLCSLCLAASSLRPTRCARAQRILLQAPHGPETHTWAKPMSTDQFQALADHALVRASRQHRRPACSCWSYQNTMLNPLYTPYVK